MTTEQTALLIISAIGVGITVITVIGTTVMAYNALVQRLIRSEVEIEQLKENTHSMRVMLESMGDSAIRQSHYDDDRLGMDSLVEEYVRRECELSPAEWQAMFEAYSAILADDTKTPNDKVIANIGKAYAAMKLVEKFSKHKLTMFGGKKLPPQS